MCRSSLWLACRGILLSSTCQRMHSSGSQPCRNCNGIHVTRVLLARGRASHPPQHLWSPNSCPFFLGHALRCHPMFIPVFVPHCMQAAGEPQSCGDLGVESRLLCPRPPVRQAREHRGGTAPHRIQPLHLHVVLGVKVHTDGHCLHPGVVCVPWVIEVSPVYLCMGMSSPHHLSEGTLGVGGHRPAGLLSCWRAEPCSHCSWSCGESLLQAQTLVWAALLWGLWPAP